MFEKLARFMSDLNTMGGCQVVGEKNAKLLLNFFEDNGWEVVQKEDGEPDQ